MKLRNLAFFGVMASILGINGAYADTTDTAVVIASQAYVDAHKNDTSMHTDTTSKTNWTSAYTATSGAATTNALAETDGTKLTKVSSIKDMIVTSTPGIAATETAASDTKVPTEKAVRAAIAAVDVSGAVSNGDNALSLTDATDKAPSVHAVQGMVSTTDMITANQSGQITSVSEGDSAHVPTTAVVSDVIKKMHAINADATTANQNAVVNITQENGQVTVTKGTLATTAIEFSNAEKAALSSGIDTGGVAQITTNKEAIDDLESAVNGKEDKSNKIDSITVGTMGGLGGISDSDNKYPTVKVVAEVQNSLNTSLSNKQDISDSTVAPAAAGTSYIAITAGNDVGGNLEALDAQVKENASDIALKADSDDVYSKDDADEKFEVLTNKVSTAEALKNAANSTTDKNNKYPSAGAIAEYVEGATIGKLDKNTAITAKNNSIVNYDANGLVTGGTLLEDATDGLTGVNAETAGNMGCSTSNPCVLTYLGGSGSAAKYRWTAMDTDQLTAQ